MNLHSLKLNRLTLILGAFLAFMVFTMPHAAWAQDTCDVDNNGDFYNAYSTSLHNQAGNKTSIHYNYMKNQAPTLDIKLHYCTTLINDIIKFINLTANPKALIIDIISTIVFNFLSQLCSVAVTLVTGLTALMTSKFNFICMSMPQLHLGVHFPHVSTCPGMGLISLQPMANQSNAPGGASDWQIWNKLPVYVPKGP